MVEKPNMKLLLHVEGVSKSYRQGAESAKVLDNVGFDLREGECLAIIGGSGSGKSTLTRIAFGLERCDEGQVLYEGELLGTSRKTETFRRFRVDSGVVFQNPFSSLDPRWTVARSVAEPLRIQQSSLPRAEVTNRVAQSLSSVGLNPDEFMPRYPADLSGGQAQRVALARALVNEPKIILADEAMSALDVAARVHILEVFASIRASHPRTAIIMVSHDLGVVQHIADRILVLHNGVVKEVGSTQEVLTSPQTSYTRELLSAASI